MIWDSIGMDVFSYLRDGVEIPGHTRGSKKIDDGSGECCERRSFVVGRNAKVRRACS